MVLTTNRQAELPPLVTIVTSTWQRPETLRECAVWSVNSQTYPNIEHLVVVDGPSDRATVNMLDNENYSFGPSSRRMVILGRNWTTYSGDGGAGATCRLVGSWMAAGELITYLDDDATYEPSHIGEMAALFADPRIAFATTRWGGINTSCCPGPPPGLNRTDTSTIMHRARVLATVGGFRPDGYAGDGNMVERWLAAGLQWAFKESVTVMHPTGHHHGGPMP